MLGTSFGLSVAGLLVTIGFLSGIGITAIGPGGIFVTITLYILTPLSTAEVAGSAHAMFVATGVIGSAAYVHSGEMSTSDGKTLAVILSGTSIIGALAGAQLNSYVPRPVFGLLLGGVTVAAGSVIFYRQRYGLSPKYRVDVASHTGKAALGLLGVVLGACSGLLGVGGPVLAVPALVVIGVPMLLAVAVAQVQSVFIAAFATTSYLLQGDVSVSVILLVGGPLLVGVISGWHIAHQVDQSKLKTILSVVLLIVGPYLALQF